MAAQAKKPNRIMPCKQRLEGVFERLIIQAHAQASASAMTDLGGSRLRVWIRMFCKCFCLPAPHPSPRD